MNMNTTTVATTPSHWAAPRLSSRWWPVFLRNLLVWKKLAVPSLANILSR
jgi:lipooligosaccharide transport system permease protein